MSLKRLLSLFLVLTLCISLLAACGKKNPGDGDGATDPTKTPDVEGTEGEGEGSSTTPLVVGYKEFSERFSPFFSTTGYDRDATAMTQVSLMTTDRTGGIIYNAIEGETVSYNGVDYEYKGISNIKVDFDEAADITTYTIDIRDDVKFSDGEVLDADDIIFSYYVISDTAYDGSSTIYSVPIIGMQNYRYNSTVAETVTDEAVAKELENPSEATKQKIIDEIIVPVLTDELAWVEGIYGDERYASYTEEFPVTKDLFANFYSIDESYDSTDVEEAQVLADIIAQYGFDYAALANGYAGDKSYFDADAANIAKDGIIAEASAKGGEEVPNIAGIKKLSQTSVEVKTYGFDATAIYKICGIEVAPLHYYGDTALYDYDNNQFGFERGDMSVPKSKTTQPLGAGPYKFVKFENKVIYYEANEHFYKGTPKTTFVQFKETAEADMISGIGTGTIDVTDPSGSVAAFEEISGYNDNSELTGNVITTNTVDNLGYGYIGLNAETMNVAGEAASEASKNLRLAFATVISVYRDVAIDSYYGEVASIINYPISNTSWAAPQKSDAGYQVAFSKGVDGNDLYTSDMNADDKYAAAINGAVEYLKAAGYTFDEASGKFTAAPEGAKLDYEIIIGAEGKGDHPSFAILTAAREALETIGITLTINDPSDSNLMWDKLEAGTQEMWVAAWGASIDPDMYQIYYSTNAVGLGGTDSNHYHIADKELDSLIMAARQSADQPYRKATYKAALDIIMDWAVEIPVYQRQNCVIMSSERVKIDTVTPDITTYWVWMNDIELLQMN